MQSPPITRSTPYVPPASAGASHAASQSSSPSPAHSWSSLLGPPDSPTAVPLSAAAFGKLGKPLLIQIDGQGIWQNHEKMSGHALSLLQSMLIAFKHGAPENGNQFEAFKQPPYSTVRYQFEHEKQLYLANCRGVSNKATGIHHVTTIVIRRKDDQSRNLLSLDLASGECEDNVPDVPDSQKRAASSSPLQDQWPKRVKREPSSPPPGIAGDIASRSPSSGQEADTPMPDARAAGGLSAKQQEKLPQGAPVAGAASFVLPEELKLDPDIRAILDQLQADLDADPAKTQEQKEAGPSATDLRLRLIQDMKFAHLPNEAIRQTLTAFGHFDAYRENQPVYVTLADALADLCTFDRHARAAKTYAPKMHMAYLHALCGACFPSAPARQKMADLLDTEKAFGKMAANPVKRQSYLNYGTAVDVHLANGGLHFADVCRLDGPEHDDAANKGRTERFIRMKDEMIANAPTDTSLKDALKTLRLHLHPLPQDKDLATRIDGATYQNGDPVPDSTKGKWKSIALSLAEALAQGGVDEQTFVSKVREAGKNDPTPAQKLATFQSHNAPFPGSTLNYAAIKAKLGGVSIFDGMLLHILNHPNYRF